MAKPVTRREFLKLAVVGAAAPWLLACAEGEKERAVNFFNWSKYIGKDTIPRFTKETGVKVNYEEFADEAEMFAKLRSGARGYDLIIGTDYMIPSLRGLNVIDPFPPGVLKNLKNVDKQFMNTPYDPDNAFTVPYLWGTTGIGYNKKQMPKPPTSWWDLWDEKYSGKISILDNARDCVSLGFLLKGIPETTSDEKDFAAVRDLFVKQRPLVKQYSSTQYMDSLVAGELFMAMAWSGDVLQSARENPHLDYIIPKEGSYMWVDNLCLVRGSQHREDTLRLVDYLLEGPVGAEIANTVRYATPNAVAKKDLDKELLHDPRVFPPAKVAKGLKFHAMLEPDVASLWTDTWEDVKVAG